MKEKNTKILVITGSINIIMSHTMLKSSKS